MQVNPRHRSSPATLLKLAGWHLFFDLDPAQSRGLPPLAALGARVAAQLASGGASNRSLVLDDASRALVQFTGIGSLRGFTANERQAWQRWSIADRRAVARVLRAKGGRRESDFAVLFAAHPQLVRSFFKLREGNSEHVPFALSLSKGDPHKLLSSRLLPFVLRQDQHERET
jgi:hypothetical protein